MINDIDEVGWYKGNAQSLMPICLKKPNKLGLYDMSGNVAETCWFVGKDGKVAVKIRGGSAKYSAQECYTYGYTYWASFIGLRVVYSDV